MVNQIEIKKIINQKFKDILLWKIKNKLKQWCDINSLSNYNKNYKNIIPKIEKKDRKKIKIILNQGSNKKEQLLELGAREQNIFYIDFEKEDWLVSKNGPRMLDTSLLSALSSEVSVPLAMDKVASKIQNMEFALVFDNNPGFWAQKTPGYAPGTCAMNPNLFLTWDLVYLPYIYIGLP